MQEVRNIAIKNSNCVKYQIHITAPLLVNYYYFYVSCFTLYNYCVLKKILTVSPFLCFDFTRTITGRRKGGKWCRPGEVLVWWRRVCHLLCTLNKYPRGPTRYLLIENIVTHTRTRKHTYILTRKHTHTHRGQVKQAIVSNTLRFPLLSERNHSQQKNNKKQKIPFMNKKDYDECVAAGTLQQYP